MSFQPQRKAFFNSYVPFSDQKNVTLGLTTTVDFIGRPLGPRPTISIERWHVGQCASIRGCGGTAGRLTGSAVLLADNQVCFLTGVLDLCHRLEQWEPDELRGSCPVLRAAAGEAPAADSTLAAHDGAWRVPVPLSHHGCLEPPHCRLARGGARVLGRGRRSRHTSVLGQQCRPTNALSEAAETPSQKGRTSATQLILPILLTVSRFVRSSESTSRMSSGISCCLTEAIVQKVFSAVRLFPFSPLM